MVSGNKLLGFARYDERPREIFIKNIWTNPAHHVAFYRNCGRTIGTELISHMLSRHKVNCITWGSLRFTGHKLALKAEEGGRIHLLNIGDTPTDALIKKEVKPILPVTPIHKVARKLL